MGESKQPFFDEEAKPADEKKNPSSAERIIRIRKDAWDKYNNLIPSIEIGGILMHMVPFRTARELGREMTPEAEILMPRGEALETYMQEEMKNIGLTKQDGERFAQMSEMARANPERMDDSDVEEALRFVEKVDQLFISLQSNGFKGVRFSAEEIRQ